MARLAGSARQERRNVLITGCSSGFGFQTALRFARGDWRVFAGVRDLGGAGARELEQIKSAEKLPLELLRLDVNSDESVAAAVSYVRESAERLEALINNAGFGYSGPVEDFTAGEVKDQFETNVFGIIRLTNAVVPWMREKGGGMIINIGSLADRVTFPSSGVYSASKHAVAALTGAWRFELKPFGIKVTLIEPGLFRTEFGRKRKFPARGMRKPEIPNPPVGGRDDTSVVSGCELYKREAKKFFHLLFPPGSPEQLAEFLWSLAHHKNPCPRYLIGRDAYFFYYLHRLLPTFLWDKLWRWVYGFR